MFACQTRTARYNTKFHHKLVFEKVFSASQLTREPAINRVPHYATSRDKLSITEFYTLNLCQSN